jgi:hypothetical protein
MAKFLHMKDNYLSDTGSIGKGIAVGNLDEYHSLYHLSMKEILPMGYSFEKLIID